MALSVSSSRPSTTTGAFRTNLPIIAHPRANADVGSLEIKGESRQGSVCSQLRASVCGGEFGNMDIRSNLPPLLGDVEGRSMSAMSANWPPEYGNRIPGDKGKFRRSLDSARNYTPDELDYIMAEKLTTGIHGLHHLFKSHDPSGRGMVSREALQRILFGLVGYIDTERYKKFMKRIGLDKMETISFNAFVECFKGSNMVEKQEKGVHHEWLSPAQQMPVFEKVNPEFHLKNYGVPKREAFVSATYALSLLRDQFRDGKRSVRDYISASVFSPDGRVLKPHLKELLDNLQIRINLTEFHKLWRRFDTDNTGSVKMHQLLKCLGLNEEGRPRPSSSPKRIVINAMPMAMQRAKTVIGTTSKDTNKTGRDSDTHIPGDNDWKRVENDVNGSDNRNNEAQKTAKSTKFMIKRKPVPKLEKLVDCLFYKFEEPYHALLQGMQCFDFLGDGQISRIDFKRVLLEFGLNVLATDLEHFLSKNGIRSHHGQVSYEEVLTKFMNRSESGIVNRIVTSSFHAFSKDRLPKLSPGETVNVEQLEARLVDMLHADFLMLLGNFRKCDKHNIGVITAHDFRDNIDRLLGYQMSNTQWQQLINTIKLDDRGLVPYPKFMEIFNAKLDSWNRQEVGPITMKLVSKPDTPSVVEQLQKQAREMNEERELRWEKERKEQERKDKEDKERRQALLVNGAPQKRRDRPVDELHSIIGDLFRKRFHSIDKVFKSVDRRVTGRFNKNQFREMLRECDIDLSQGELDSVWDNYYTSDDNLYTFTAIVHFYAEAEKGHSISTDRADIELPGRQSRESTKRREQRKDKSAVFERQEKIPLLDRTNTSHLTSPGRDILLDKIRNDVVNHWEKLKSIFRQIDKRGTAKVMAADMREVITVFDFTLTDSEINKLLSKFDYKNNGQFYYVSFLKSFTRQGRNGNTTNGNSYTLQQKQAPQHWNIEYPTLMQVIDRIREKLLKDHNSIRKAFKSFDKSGNGYLSVQTFRKVFDECNISLNNDDLYQIMSHFDSGMTNRVYYEDFMQNILGLAR